MKDNLTEVVALYSDNIPEEAFTAMAKAIKENFKTLKNPEKEIRFTVASFGKGDGYKKLCENTPVDKLKPDKLFIYEKDSFKISLIDSATALIDDLGERYRNTQLEDLPGRIIFVIISFGKDNASKKHTYEDLKWVVAHQSGIYKWEFYVVSDTETIAEKLEIPPENAVIASDGDESLTEAMEKLFKSINKE